MTSSRYVVFIGVLVFNCVKCLEASKLRNYTIPKELILGVSTAAFQIEGGWNEGGRGESMWDTYLHKHPNYTVDGSNGDVATDSYHKYKEDVQMLRFLGVKYYRMSLSWSRILPNGTDNYVNEEGIHYYKSLFKELRKYNIMPVVTLFHWDLPQVFMELGGWTNPKILDYFEAYARIVFKRFGDEVKIWTTINEPHQHCYNGYGMQYFVPALESHGIGDWLCSHYMLLGHARVYRLYDKEFRKKQKGKIGITLDAFFGVPENANKKEDVEAVERYIQMTVGVFAHPIFSIEGDYPKIVRERVDNISAHQGFPKSRLPKLTKEQIEDLKGSSDFFGLNHYTSFVISHSSFEPEWYIPSMDHDIGVKMRKRKDWPKPAAAWFTIYPEGFRGILNWITKNYGTTIPIIVTENGSCDYGGIDDYVRVKYYNDYIYQMLLAIHEDGCNIAGYFAWTLMDDFEWTDGYLIKFGLFQVDFTSPELTRTPKLSAINYKEIVRTRRINFNYIKKPNIVYKYYPTKNDI